MQNLSRKLPKTHHRTTGNLVRSETVRVPNARFVFLLVVSVTLSRFQGPVRNVSCSWRTVRKTPSRNARVVSNHQGAVRIVPGVELQSKRGRVSNPHAWEKEKSGRARRSDWMIDSFLKNYVSILLYQLWKERRQNHESDQSPR